MQEIFEFCTNFAFVSDFTITGST